MTILIWSRLFTPKCSCAMSLKNKKSKWKLNREKHNSKKKLICNGKSLKNKRWKNTMSVSEKNLKKSITRKWKTPKMFRTNLRTSSWTISRKWRRSNLRENLLRSRLRKSSRGKNWEILRERRGLLAQDKSSRKQMTSFWKSNSKSQWKNKRKKSVKKSTPKRETPWSTLRRLKKLSVSKRSSWSNKS